MNPAVSETIDASQFDEYGLLKDVQVWSEPLANAIASDIGVGTLTDAHWLIIYTLRDHYARFGAPPVMHRVCQEAGIERRRVTELFGYCLNAWRVAGLPNPGEEATSYLSNM
jgi:tRNA 2-thiouridine synthesizing protein E